MTKAERALLARVGMGLDVMMSCYCNDRTSSREAMVRRAQERLSAAMRPFRDEAWERWEAFDPMPGDQ